MAEVDAVKTNLVTCENCGAEFDIHEAKCPFCGHINPYGAEEKYMQQMQDIKSNLAQVDDEQIEVIKKETKKTGKIVLITLLSIVAVILVAGAILYVYTWKQIQHFESLGLYESDPLKAAKWNDEHLADMEAMYDAGDIDGLVEYYGKLYDEGNIGAFNSWSHSFLITQIYDLRFWTNYLEDDKLDDLVIHQLMFNLLYYYNGDYKGTNMPDEDQTIIMEEVQKHLDKASDRFGITAELLEEMNTHCIGEYGYIDPAKVADYCDAHKEMFR